MEKNSSFLGWVIGILAVIIVAVGIIWWANGSFSSSVSRLGVSSAAIPSSSTATVPPPDTSLTLTGGEISLSYPGYQFGLATGSEPIPANSYIPPCDPGFDYCFYWNNTSTYAGTNFDTAGLRIERRADLTTQSSCLNTLPTGFGAALGKPATSTAALYAASTFPNVGTAAAGHAALGSLYRVFVKSSSNCYEFETRLGTSAFANYPSGSIQQFDAMDQQAVLDSLNGILGTLSLASSNMPIVLPGAAQ